MVNEPVDLYLFLKEVKSCSKKYLQAFVNNFIETSDRSQMPSLFASLAEAIKKKKSNNFDTHEHIFKISITNYAKVLCDAMTFHCSCSD